VTQNDTIATSSTTYSLEFGASTPSNTTVTLATDAITSGGILMTPGAGSATIKGGTLSTGSTGGELIINQWNTTASLTISSLINSTTVVTKSGSGALILGGTTDSYTGKTYVNQGTLIVSGSLSGAGGAITVAALSTLEVDGSTNSAKTITDTGGTLQGQGQALGVISVSQGGSLAPGLSVNNTNTGTLTTSSNVSLDFTSAFNIRLGQLSAGTDNDQLKIGASGTATLNNSTLNLTLGANFANAPVDTFYNILVGGYNDTTSGYFGNAVPTTTPGIATLTVNGDQFEVIYGSDGSTDGLAFTGNNSDITVEFIGVPEPSTWASILAGAGMLLVMSRRRARRIS
jgi:autotransporter-associated beta strand protein